MKKIIFSLVVASFLFGGLSVLANHDSSSSAGVTPDSQFYFFKTLKENIQTFFTFGEENKARQYLHLADVRLAEYQKMLEKGKTELAQKTLDKYEKQLNRAISKAEELKSKNKDVKDISEKIATTTAKHIDILENNLLKVPESAKKGIERALENAKKIRGEGARLGIIEGSLGYPSDFIPGDMKVCAENILDKKQHCTENHLKDKKYQYGIGYKIEAPVGDYYVYASLPGRENYKSYYSEFVACGLRSDCPSHKPIVVSVKFKEIVANINPQDWYDVPVSKNGQVSVNTFSEFCEAENEVMKFSSPLNFDEDSANENLVMCAESDWSRFDLPGTGLFDVYVLKNVNNNYQILWQRSTQEDFNLRDVSRPEIVDIDKDGIDEILISGSNWGGTCTGLFDMFYLYSSKYNQIFYGEHGQGSEGYISTNKPGYFCQEKSRQPDKIGCGKAMVNVVCFSDNLEEAKYQDFKTYLEGVIKK